MAISEAKFNGGSNEFDISEDIMLNFDLGRLKVITPTTKAQRVYLPNAQLTPWIEGGVVYDVINLGSYSIFVFDWEGNYTGIEIGPNQRGGISLGNTDPTQGDAWRCNCRDLLSVTTTTSTTSTTSTTTTPTTTSTTSITSSTTNISTLQTQYTGTWGDPNDVAGGSNEDPRIDPNYTNLPVFAAPPMPFGHLSAPIPKMKGTAAVGVSVVVTSINEGPDLEMTLASLCERLLPSDEIVVVDDGSVEPLSRRVRAFESSDGPDIVYVRHDERKGCAQARASGSRVASGELLIFVDSHMFFPANWREEMVKAHLLNPGAVLCPISADIDEDGDVKDGGHWGTNADLYMHPEKGLTAQWAPIPAQDDRLTIPTPSMMGACYAASQRVLRALGGWAMGLRGWGFDEEFLSARAWMQGFEVRLVPSTFAAHRYIRGESNTRADSKTVEEESWVLVYTRAYMNFVLFGEPLWVGTEDEIYRASMEAVTCEHEWKRDREYLLSQAKMTPAQFWRIMNEVRSDANIQNLGGRHAIG